MLRLHMCGPENRGWGYGAETSYLPIDTWYHIDVMNINDVCILITARITLYTSVRSVHAHIYLTYKVKSS